MPEPDDSTDFREVRLFRNNRSQAVRIPADFALPGERVRIRRDGRRLILEPVEAPGLLALVDGWTPIEEDIGEIADPPLPAEDVFADP